MKRIVFNAMILNDRPTGLGVYCKNILSRIDIDKLNHILYIDNYEGRVNTTKDVVLKFDGSSKMKSILNRNLFMKKWISKQENIVHYSPTQHGVSNKNIKQIITVHDLMPLYFPEGRIHQFLYYKLFLKKIIRNSDLVITVSNNTKKDLIKEYKIKEDKVKVVYNGFDKPEVLDKEESKDIVKDKFGVNDYILMIGIHYAYKNLHSVIEAYDLIKDEIDKPIVIVGNDDCKYGNQLKELVKSKGLEDRVLFLGYVSNEDKNRLYQAAKLFIYPSKYEGFGLPVLEAMANNTLVACSNTSSLPEVVGDAAIMFNPNSIEDIRDSIKQVYNLTADEYLKFIEKGNIQISKFSWDKCASEVEREIISMAQGEV